MTLLVLSSSLSMARVDAAWSRPGDESIRLLGILAGQVETLNPIKRAASSVQGQQNGAANDESAKSVTSGIQHDTTARALDTVNVADYGAKCDGSTDDAEAFNAALTMVRATASLSGTLAWPIGHSARLVAPKGVCLIKSTLNATGLYGSGFVWDGWGTTLLGQTGGTPMIDAIGTGQASFQGLNLYGAGTDSPSIGLALGRLTQSLSAGADHNLVLHPTITGYFTLAAYYNRSSETTLVSHGWFSNQQPHAFGAIFDGSNHFNVQSAFTGRSYTADVFSSFNENTCDQCVIETFGAGTIPLWIGGSARHSWRNSYVLSDQAVPGTYIYSDGSAANDFLDLDIHYESTALTSLLRFGGSNANPVVHGLRLRDNGPQQSGPVFSRDNGVNSVTIQDADLHIGTLRGTSPSWWDNAAVFTLGGQVYSGDSSFTLPTGGFSGRYCLGVTCNVTDGLPSNLTVGSISNPGSVVSIKLGSFNGNYQGGYVPVIKIAAPPSSGQQAMAHAALAMYGSPTIGSGGSGYAVGDILTVTGGRCTAPPTARVNTVVSGAVTALGFFGAGVCTATPTNGVSLAGGSGKGATLGSENWTIIGVMVDFAGAGYTTAPTVSASGPSGFAATGLTAVLDSLVTISAGTGQVLLDGAGTKLGVAGTGGSPVLMQGVAIDATGVRPALTGKVYTVPANVGLVRFTQTSSVVSQLVALPMALADGQPIQFVNYAGPILSLSFSPSVSGWVNGAGLAPYIGLRIRWDAVSGNWQREE